MLEIIAEIYLGTATVMNKIVTFLICFSLAKKHIVAHPLLTPVIILFYISLGYPFWKAIVEGISDIISLLFENYLESKNGFWYRWKYKNRSWYQGTNHERWNQYWSNWAESQNPELRDALAFYGFAIPFSEAQLKAAHRKFMKTAHPDAGGDEEYAKKSMFTMTF